MNARILIYPSLLLAAATVLTAFMQNADLLSVFASLEFLSLLFILVALRRKQEAPQMPPEFQAKLASLEHQNQRQLKQLNETLSGVESAEKKALEAEAQAEKLRSQIASYEAALQREKALKSAEQNQGSGEQAVIQFVRNMQSRGRILDFLMADIHKLADAQVGAAARVVHQGLSELMNDYFSVKPIETAAEGLMIPLREEELGLRYKLLQSRGETLPSEGRLLHKGWKAGHVKLPQSQRQENAEERLVLALAEVDVGEGGLQ